MECWPIGGKTDQGTIQWGGGRTHWPLPLSPSSLWERGEFTEALKIWLWTSQSKTGPTCSYQARRGVDDYQSGKIALSGRGQEGLMVVPLLNCPSTWYWCWSTSVPNGPGGHHLNACKVSPTGPWCVHFDFDNSGVVNDIPLLMIETFQPTYIYFYCKFARWERLCHIDVGIEHFLSDTVR